LHSDPKISKVGFKAIAEPAKIIKYFNPGEVAGLKKGK
jgi:hypothetical protein